MSISAHVCMSLHKFRCDMCVVICVVCVFAHVWNEIDERKMTDAILQFIEWTNGLENQ